MKRNLTKRVFAAAALAVIAAAVSACGSSNNNGTAVGATCVAGQICTSGVAGLSGVSLTSNGTGCVISFSGSGSLDYTGGINGQFAVSGEQTGTATAGYTSTSGYLTAGYINSVDGAMIELQLTPIGTGTYSITGVLSMSADEAPYGCTTSVSEVTLSSVLMTPEQLGQPFTYQLGGGLGGCSTGVILNGNMCVPST